MLLVEEVVRSQKVELVHVAEFPARLKVYRTPNRILIRNISYDAGDREVFDQEFRPPTSPEFVG